MSEPRLKARLRLRLRRGSALHPLSLVARTVRPSSSVLVSITVIGVSRDLLLSLPRFCLRILSFL